MEKPRKKILIVDDDSTMREALKLILLDANYDIVGLADNGESAISQYIKLWPDLVLLDINMPKMDGLHALEKIRLINPSARVMMVSVESKLNKVQEAIMLGASGFIVKPLNAANVLDRVERSFKRRSLK